MFYTPLIKLLKSNYSRSGNKLFKFIDRYGSYSTKPEKKEFYEENKINLSVLYSLFLHKPKTLEEVKRAPLTCFIFITSRVSSQ